MLAVGCSSAQTLMPVTTMTGTASVSTIPTKDVAGLSPSAIPEPSTTLLATLPHCTVGWIVFASHVSYSQDDLRDGVYKTCADGTSRQQLIATEAGIPVGAWPDGTGFLYADYEMPLQVINLAGKHVAKLDIGSTYKGTVGRLSVSPDGEYAFYQKFLSSDGGTPARFEILHLPTGIISEDLVSLDYYDQIGITVPSIIPTWSPRGNHIVWRLADRLDIADVACDAVLHTCSLQNIREIGIVPRIMGNNGISWSPDGMRWVVPCIFTNDPNEYSRLCIFDLSGTLLEDYDNTDIGVGIVYNPSWSPTGDRIAFSDGRNLYILFLADHKIINLTTQYGTIDDVPIWIP